MKAGADNIHLRAASLIVFCMVTIAFSDTLMPFVSDDFGLWQFHATRSLIACGLFLLLGLYFKWNFIPKSWSAVAIRSFLFGTGMILYFAALGFVPVAQAGAGLFMAPIFVLLFSVFAFGTPIGLWRILAVIIGFVGALLVLKPTQGAFSGYSLLPVLGAVFYALGLIATRRLCSEESAISLVFWFLVMAGVYGLLGACFFDWVLKPETLDTTFLSRGWIAPTPKFLWVTSGMGLVTMVALTAQARGYQMADASYLAVFEYSFLVSATFWGWVLWGQELDALAIIGMIAIAISGTLIALRTSVIDG